MLDKIRNKVIFLDYYFLACQKNEHSLILSDRYFKHVFLDASLQLPVKHKYKKNDYKLILKLEKAASHKTCLT